MAVKKKSQTGKSGHKSADLPSAKKIGPVLIVSGEHSGDLLGASLMREMNRLTPGISFFGVGGEEMKKENFESLEDIENMTVIGISGVFFKYSFLKKLLNRIVMIAEKKECKYAILIDYPGFNLRLAKELKKKNIKIIFYVSPQIWAWRFNRIYSIRENVDLMLTLFQFEKKIYDEYGVNAEFVGHPLVGRIKTKILSEKKIEPKPDTTTICLMPGSRTDEIRRLLPVMAETAIRLNADFNLNNRKVQFLLPNVSIKDESYIQNQIGLLKEKGIDIEYFFDRSIRCIQVSDLVILSSGTATLEVAYFEKPMVILYKVSLITFFIGSRLIRTPYIGIINILSGEETCRELLQTECKPEYVCEEVMNILKNPEYRERMVSKIREVKSILGTEDASRRAAKFTLKLIQNSPD